MITVLNTNLGAASSFKDFKHSEDNSRTDIKVGMSSFVSIAAAQSNFISFKKEIMSVKKQSN